MTFGDELVEAVDGVSKELSTSRSAFARKALRDAIARYTLERIERTHRKGYEWHPVGRVEFLAWEIEQAWGDE